MWTEYQRARVVYPEDHRLMGRTLKPFCLEYQFWMEVFESPLMFGGPLSIADLEIASLICTSEYGEAKYIPIRELKRRKTLIGKVSFLLANWRTKMEDELLAFGRYTDDWCSSPELVGSMTSTQPASEASAETVKNYSAFPSCLSVASVLMTGGFEGGNREKIWMCPLGEAYWWCAAIMRAKGDQVEIKTPYDREFEEQLRKKFGGKGGVKS